MAHELLIAVAVVLVFLLVYRFASAPAEPVASPAPKAPPQKAKAKIAPAVAASSPNPPKAAKAPESARALPNLSFEEDADVDPTRVGARTKTLSPPTTKILYDEDAATEEPTQPRPLILVTATGKTDRGVRRRNNEDSVLVLEDLSLFVVADGMGGYRGGEVASKLAVSTIEKAFLEERFEGPPHEAIPKRASELARAIQMANDAIFDRANAERQLEGMGTTVCAARFSRNKQRLYVGHVGDSRVYCYRDGKLHRMTSDHTMADLGVGGEGAAHLSRAVGVWPTVPIDIILGKPRPHDVYLLCSDGLTKMVSDEEIEQALNGLEPKAAVEKLIELANEHGGKDNVSVVIVRVDEPAPSSAVA